MEWISVNQAADILNVSTEDLTPTAHGEAYKEAWDSHHDEPSGTLTAASNASGIEETVRDELVSAFGPLPPSGSNLNATSISANYDNSVANQQVFLLWNPSLLYERPDATRVDPVFLWWIADIVVAEPSQINGFAARGVLFRATRVEDLQEAGAQTSGEKVGVSCSVVFAEHSNVFEGQCHGIDDDWTVRWWDSGLNTMPSLSWESHDEGDASSNALSSSFAGTGIISWLAVEEAASLLNVTVDQLTPDTFGLTYKETWEFHHPSSSSSSPTENENESGASPTPMLDDDTASPAPTPLALVSQASCSLNLATFLPMFLAALTLLLRLC